MATEDSNGLVIFQDTDNLVPLHSTLNTLTASISDAFNENVRIYPVSSTSSRSALVSQIGLSNISTAKPLFVWRSNATQGRNLEYTTNGSTWHYYSSSDDSTGFITSGLTFAMESGWTLNSYCLYREGKRAYGSVTVNRSGGTITPDANGNFTDAPVLTMPVGWRMVEPTPVQTSATRTGVNSAFARFDVSPAGRLVATHGITGQQILNGQGWTFDVNYRVEL